MSSLSDQPPDGGLAAWGNVGAAFFVMAHTPAMHYIYGLVFVEWLEAFPGSSRAAVAGCGSLSTGVMLGAAYASGSLQARGMAPGRVVAIGAALAVVGLLATSFATALWECYLYFSVVVGFAHALAFPPCPLVASSWFTSRKNVAVGVATSGSGAGTVYLGLVVSAVLQGYDSRGNNDNNDNDNTNTGGAGDDGYDDRGWRAAFRLLALLSAVAIGGAALVLRVPGGPGLFDGSCASNDDEQKKINTDSKDHKTTIIGNKNDRHKNKNKNKNKIEANSNSSSSSSSSRRSENKEEGEAKKKDHRLPVCMLLRDRRLSMLCLAYAAMAFAWEVPFVHLTAFAIDVGTFPSAAKAWPLTVGIGCGGFLGRILVTRAADVCGVRLMCDARFFLV